MSLPTVPNKTLYHYCSLDTAIRYILPSKQLRISPLQNTNDPRENKDLIFGAISNSGSFPVEELAEMMKSVSKIIREGAKALCFSQDSEHLDGYQLSQMWAHYSSRHQGICISIDYEKFKKENKSIIKENFFRKVNYVSPKQLKHTLINHRYRNVDFEKYKDQLTSKEYLKNEFRKRNADYLFFTKSIEWQSEQEFRLIHFGDPTCCEFCSIADSITGIFLGVEFNKNYLPSIQYALDKKDCPIWELEYGGEWLACKANHNT